MLLLSCCAPCSCGVIDRLAGTDTDFTVLFYNPNILDETEYRRRLDENKRICNMYNVPFVELEYDPENWRTTCENAPFKEQGPRCSLCFHMRLKKAAEYAKANGFDTFTSVLGISRRKNIKQVNAAGDAVSSFVGIPYDATNWRLNGIYTLMETLPAKLGLYRQNYCGCMPLKK